MYNIFSVPKNVLRVYNISNVYRNVNNKTFLSLDVLAVMIREVESIADMILNVRTTVKVKRKSPNNKIRYSISIPITKDHGHPFQNDLPL